MARPNVTGAAVTVTADPDGVEVAGPLTHGFAGDQWLGRIKSLSGKLFHVWYTVEGTWKLMRRNDWSCQMPVRQDRRLMSVADHDATGGERHAKTVPSPKALPGEGVLTLPLVKHVMSRRGGVIDVHGECRCQRCRHTAEPNGLPQCLANKRRSPRRAASWAGRGWVTCGRSPRSRTARDQTAHQRQNGATAYQTPAGRLAAKGYPAAVRSMNGYTAGPFRVRPGSFLPPPITGTPRRAGTKVPIVRGLHCFSAESTSPLTTALT